MSYDKDAIKPPEPLLQSPESSSPSDSADGPSISRGKEAITPPPRKRWLSQSTRLLNRLASVLTLVLAYLAVAVTAHWFPWQTNIPAVTLYLAPGQESNSAWEASVNELIDFLNDHHARTVHLHLIMQNFTLSRQATGKGPLLYVDEKPPPAGVADFSMRGCGPRREDYCPSLAVYVVSGPGSNLGYDYYNSAAAIEINGYYQVGRIACQTSTCQVDVIPVEPP